MIVPAHFVRANTVLTASSLVPEIRLHLATQILPLWSKTEDEIEEKLPPPYWAFAWAGGQALARYVLDFGSGSGLVAIAAAKAGASSVLAADIDTFAIAAITLNARANDVEIDMREKDILEHDCLWDTVLVGDMCYERPLAERLLAWLSAAVGDGKHVLLGDPGRNYFPKSGVEKLASYNVETSRELEDRDVRATAVYRLAAGAGPT
jgi:predicted nicotinamide N-methyase